MDSVLHLQGSTHSDLTPLWLVHPISGLALPYLALGELSKHGDRPVYGINSPIYAKRTWQLPVTIDELALAYVRLLRERVQPQGPYLLGGWSMGGMIAMRMAAILEAQDERVVHVILIDAMNPDNILPFQTSQEHMSLVTLTHNRLVESVKTDRRPVLKTFCSDSGYESDFTPQFRPKLNGLRSMTTTSDMSLTSSRSSSSSSSSSLVPSRWPSEEDLQNLAKAQQVQIRDHMPDENYYEEGDDHDHVEECTPVEMLERMFQHISSGLSMIANNHEESQFGPVSAPVTLFKCNVLEKMPHTVSVARRQAVQRTFDDLKCGWDLGRLKVTRLHSAHDRVFDPEHVPEMTCFLRALLELCA